MRQQNFYLNQSDVDVTCTHITITVGRVKNLIIDAAIYLMDVKGPPGNSSGHHYNPTPQIFSTRCKHFYSYEARNLVS